MDKPTKPKTANKNSKQAKNVAQTISKDTNRPNSKSKTTSKNTTDKTPSTKSKPKINKSPATPASANNKIEADEQLTTILPTDSTIPYHTAPNTNSNNDTVSAHAAGATSSRLPTISNNILNTQNNIETLSNTTALLSEEMEDVGIINIDKNIKPEPKLISEKKAKKTFIMSEDARNNRKYAWWAYILFFIPLLINHNSDFVKTHANEGLKINIIDAIALIFLLVGMIATPLAHWVHFMLIIFVWTGLTLFTLTTITKIFMIIIALKGKNKTTPWLPNGHMIK